MAGDSYKLFEYSIDALKQLLVENTSSSLPLINKKLHLQYFEGYFSFIQAKTILAEFRYVDHDYLEDFSGYYVKSFKAIPRKCTRLHFFQTSFDEDQFEKIVVGKESDLTPKILQDNYLGFIVVKPLPETIIGRTCLKTYPQETSSHSRHFPITRLYSVNLFGIQLSVDTLAFQEQDKVTAACATSALWSIFQGTGKLFQHAIPSPVEITKAATNDVPVESRVIPSNGLNAHQMAQAIRDLDLEPLSINVEQEAMLKATTYAYLKGKIPLLLAIELFDTSSTPSSSIGHHAVAVAGCGVAKGSPVQFDASGFLLKAMNVDKLYAHDDQIGPFARMEVGGVQVIDGSGNKKDSLSTSWRDNGTGRAVPYFLLIPLHNKIRIPFGSILERVYSFDYFLEVLKSNGYSLNGGRLEWDIYLSTVNTFKSEFRSQADSRAIADKFKILTKRMPRFIWIAKAKINRETSAAGEPFLDLVFDATGIEQGNLFVRAVEYDDNFSSDIRTIIKSNTPPIKDRLEQCDIFKWFHSH